MKRACGILLPVTSLPSKYGIGCFSKEAYQFVDFLKKAGQTYWQILPLGETGFGNSPYQSISTFAGNPYLIDPEPFAEAGWLDREMLDGTDFGSDPERVDYEKQAEQRLNLLRTAYENSPFSRGEKKNDEYSRELDRFAEENKDWLEDYALFCAEKKKHGGAPYTEWEDGLRLRDPAVLAKEKKELAEEIRFREFVQYEFFLQYHRLKDYANSRGVRIIGDLPIYVSGDGADVWSSPELFQLDEDGRPVKVAGVPPDGFTPDGQLWGNPLYRWDKMREDGYAWWTRRMKSAFGMFDVLRIDHFRGLESYFAVPAEDTTARNGTWEKGPGYDFFRVLEQKLGKHDVIAENLGYLTPEVHELLTQTGYPGMQVLQFAFDWSQRSIYLPQYYTRNSVAYTGTHDNTTLRDWYEHLNGSDREFADRYMGMTEGEDPLEKNFRMISCLFRSVADTVIIPLQDYLGLGAQARINTPSTVSADNWSWRMKKDAADAGLADRLQLLASTFDRLQK